MSIFNFPSRAAWAMLVACGALSYGGLAALDIAIRPAPLCLTAAIVVMCLAASFIYTHHRPDRRLAAMTGGAGFLIAFGATVGALTYPAAAIGGPLRDASFIAFERAMGIDWPSLASAMSANPYLDLLWALAYLSTLPMLAVVVVVLALAGREERLATFLTLLAVTLVMTIAVSAMAPALGPIPSHGIGGQLYARLGAGGKDFLSDFQALRAGRLMTFDLAKLQGIVTFPSFHCVMAVLTAWALAPIRALRGVAGGLSVLVILSTVPQGGHYIADVLAGTLLACAAITFTARLRRESGKAGASRILAPAE